MHTPYKRVSLVDRVFERIEDDILFGRYKRGETLTEAQLTQELEVSRTPIRDALLLLEQERLIVSQGKGYLVLGITMRDLLDIMEIRLKVEGLASYYAAQNATEKELEELKEIVELQEFYTNKKDSQRIKETDDKFHSTICMICGHHVISDTLIPLHKKIQRYRRASIEDDNRTKQMVKEHRDIYEAIARGDADAASELTFLHVRNAKESMTKEAVD